MPEHSSGRVMQVRVRLDDADLDTKLVTSDFSLDDADFFFTVGETRFQLAGTPEQLFELGREMQNAAADMATRLAANRDARDARNTAAMNGWPDLPGLATS